jgi:UDP-glucose:(heptosyl)LPS alpha-1,3-glucosyltransferase
MKIALVIGDYNAFGGGAERWTDRHANYLLRAGHEVHLVARSFRNPPTGAVLHPIDVRRSRIRFAARAEQILHRLGADAVHDMGAGWFGDVFSPHHGTRVGGFRAGDDRAPPWRRPIRQWMRRWMPRYLEFHALEDRQFARGSFRTIVALSQRVKNDMVKFFDVEPSRIEVVYNGVDVERFTPPHGPQLQSHRNNIRQAWGWRDRVVFLLVAHNFQLKGLDCILRAMARLRRSETKFGLAVAGDDDSRRYRAIADRLGINSDVRFLGDQKESASLFQAADVYVQPTFYDPCSLVVLEAMASGLPTITTAANGAGELLQQGRSGFILDDPKDDLMLSEFMAATLDEQFRRVAGERARLAAESNTMDANSKRYLNLYRSNASVRRAA